VQAIKQIILLIVALGCMLAAAIWGAAGIWSDSADAEIGFHGTLALILGAVASLLVGGGLMALTFYSARRGYDDEAGR
jgi:hypothetical protein